MSMHGPYEFTDGKGKRFKVEVIIDPYRIALALAQKARTNPNRLTKACAGGVMVKVEDTAP